MSPPFASTSFPITTSTLAELHAADRTRLMLRQWPDAAGGARGTVLIVHGLGEHSGRYEEVAHRLNALRFNALAYDHRGHGRSGGPHGGLDRPDDLLTDLATVVDAARARHEGPLVLLGHSMGGLVAASFVARQVKPVDALVLSSPALDAGLSVFDRVLLAAMHAIAPRLALPNRLDIERLSHDPAVVRAYRNDPLVHDKVTARLVRFIVDAGREVREQAAQWRVPTLLMWAGADRLVNPAGSVDFAARAPRDTVRSQVFEKLYHEIFNEPEKDAVHAMLAAWLDERFPR